MYLLALLTAALAPALALAASRTTAPAGALVVNQSSGPYKTLSAAVAALPDDGSAQTIFMFPGTYTEQVLIDRSGAVTVR
ncbi:carbohydrate esterase family 8 protein, partial [Phlebiopsis gigantea 11061_1 CR5-6]